MSFERLAPYALCSFIGLGTLAGLFYKKSLYKSAKDDLNITEVLFFPDSEFPCPKVIARTSSGLSGKDACYNPSCMRLHGRHDEKPSSFIKFLRYLSNAQQRVDLCIYMFTQSNLADILQSLHKANIRVRIITDSSDDDGTGSQIDRLSRAGIEIKSNKRGTGALMHHKFVVIDGCILLSGSFNWTRKAVVSNYEAVMVTSQKSLVEPFQRKFDELWNMF